MESTNVVAQSRREEVMERLFIDLQRERFNQLNYQTRSSSVKRMSTWSNVIAALAASAALTGLLTGAGGIGPRVMQVLVGLAAISAAIGPVLGLENKASQLERAALGHAIVKDRLWSLLRDLKLSDIDDTHEARIGEIAAFSDALTALDEEPHESVKRSCWATVERELPAEQAWSII